jgi:hypothetical protein
MTLYPTSFILQRPVLGDCDRRMKKLRVEWSGYCVKVMTQLREWGN